MRDSSTAGTTPRVFVVIPTHDRWHETEVSLGRLFESSFPNFKIVLVEDGCTDDTVEQCKSKFPEVEILHGDGSLWWSGAINLGTQHAIDHGADLVMWINDDVRVEPNTISELVATIQRNGARSISCARIKAVDGSVREWRGAPPAWHPEFATYQDQDDATLPRDIPIHHPPGGQGVLIPVACFKEIGIIDIKNFPHYWADHDFHYRAMKAGFQYYVVREAIVWNVPNKTRPASTDEFSFSGVRWFLFHRRSPMNMPTLRRLLKRHLAPAEYRRIFYPILFRHLTWLSYGWLRGKPLLHAPLSAVKKTVSRPASDRPGGG